MNNVYELSSIECSICYLHATAGYLANITCVKAIKASFHKMWPLLTVTNLNKYLPKSDETVKGHLKDLKQHVCSRTKQAQREVEVGNEQVDGHEK